MTPKEKAKELVEKFQNVELLKDFEGMDFKLAKECAEIAIKNEYLSLGELVTILKPSFSEKRYLELIDNLIYQQKEIIAEIQNL